MDLIQYSHRQICSCHTGQQYIVLGLKTRFGPDCDYNDLFSRMIGGNVNAFKVHMNRKFFFLSFRSLRRLG